MSVGKDGSSLADALRSDQRQRWLAGERISVEDYIDRHPELRSDPEALFDVISGEFRLREELGEFPDVSEYAVRFPELSDQLVRLASATRPDDSEARNRSTRPIGVATPLGMHCRYCGRISQQTDANAAGEVQCEHCGKLLLVMEETSPYEMTAVGIIGRFELREHVGSGQFGDVWRAFDVDLRREVAVKIPRRTPDSRSMQALFVKEARTAARLKHPNIVSVHEVGKHDGRIYIVSDFIRGTTLKDYVKQRRFEPREAARLCATLARALHHAHQEGVVHRDLKPGNILMDVDGQPHITDFGLAKQLEPDDATLTVAGQMLGTPAYMSPEQARGQSHKADRRCDVYSLGVVLYELLTGRRPFESKGEVLTYEVLNVDPPSPRKHDRTISSALETICLIALSKETSERYATAEDLALDLERYLAGEPILGRRPSLGRRTWRWARRKRGQLAVAASVLGALVLSAGTMLANRGAPLAPIYTRQVVLDTEPSGAEVHFIPLDEISGDPLPERIIPCPDHSPVRIDLEPGDYLVVAVLEDGRFHEVWRHVPPKHEQAPMLMGAHRRWKADAQGAIHLPKIKIPALVITDGMALIDGAEHFVRGGMPQMHLNPRQECRVPSYYMDPLEFTVGDFRKLYPHGPPFHMQNDTPPDETALHGFNFDQAMGWAESAGKRLMNETEYEYAATARGKHRYPWGDEFPQQMKPEDRQATVPSTTFDRLDSDPPVLGLCSGLAEWTASKARPMLETDLRFARFAICGGVDPVTLGTMTVSAATRDPRARNSAVRYYTSPGIGFRCVRSVRPRLKPEDFVTIKSAAARGTNSAPSSARDK